MAVLNDRSGNPLTARDATALNDRNGPVAQVYAHNPLPSGTVTAFNPFAAPNVAPTVDAGVNQTITLPAAATLDGTVSDDGLPNPPGSLTTTWSKFSGPGIVTFGNAAAVDTTATFSVDGTYVLQLEADDSELQTTDTVTITVDPAVATNAAVARRHHGLHGQPSAAGRRGQGQPIGRGRRSR